MRADIYPLQMLLLTVSGWVHRHQADVIAYLVEENRILKERLDGRALRLNDDQRRRLAAKGGIRRERLPLHVAEYAWRYNHRKLSTKKQVKSLLKLIRDQSGGRE